MPETTKVAWDLSDLFDSIKDPRIEKTLNNSLSRAKRFAERYRGKIDSTDLTAATLSEAIGEYESIAQDVVKPMSYASLVFAADTSKPEHGALLQHI